MSAREPQQSGREPHKTVGVLGGLGPEATLDFLAKVLRATGASQDQDHLHLIIDNNPKVPNRNDAIAGRGPSPGPALAGMARGLEAAGADFLVMVCNAAHAFQADIEAAVSIPFLSLIEATREQVTRRVPDARTVGVLAASGCLDARLYETAFAPDDRRVLVPEGQERERFMDLLYEIKSGDTGRDARSRMRELALGLIERGAQVTVAGCTEVPLVLSAGDLPIPLVSSTDALVELTVQCARNQWPLPGARARAL